MFADGFRILSSSTALLFGHGDALYANWEILALTYSNSQLTWKRSCTSSLDSFSTRSLINAINRDLTYCG